MRKTTLICDINIRTKGHYISYNNYLINYVSVNHSDNVVKFLYNREAKYLLDLSKIDNQNVCYVDIDPKWYNNVQGKFKIWKIIKRKAIAEKVDSIVFMDFDQYQIPIGISKNPFKISGILFRPHHRIATTSKNIYEISKLWIKKNKKIILEKILLLNSNINSIFILNDAMGVDLLNHTHHTEKFKYLPDPIFDFELEKISVREEKYINFENSRVFLIFGSISERKNISNILFAYSKCHFDYSTVLLLVGPSSDKYHSYLSDLIGKLNFDHQFKRVAYINRFISDGEMEFIHMKSDISMLVYKDFYGSSGLIGRAAKHKIPVITSNVGLLNEIVTTYNLGVTVNSANIDEIAKVMENTAGILNNFPVTGFEHFYNEHTAEMFAKILITNYLNSN